MPLRQNHKTIRADEGVVKRWGRGKRKREKARQRKGEK